MRFIIVGAGAVGTTLAARLVQEDHDVVLIEKSETRITKVAQSLDIEIIIGNGCSPEVLVRAGLNTADYLVAVADIDEVNIAACLMSRLVNPDTKRIARIRDIDVHHKDVSREHLHDYFDLIINPDQAASDYLLQLFRVAGAREVIEFADGKLRVLGVRIHPDSPYIDTQLKNLTNLRDRLQVLVLAIVRDGRLLIPRGEDHLRKEDTLYCITTPERTNVLFELSGRRLSRGKSAMIWGGGPLGRKLAHALEEQHTKVKLIIPEHESSSELVDEFHHTLVLTGDGKDQGLLKEENISDIDAFIAVTPDEEDNILGCLLARKLGAKTSMALVNKATYLPLVHAIGVDVVVSSRTAAASAIFSHIHPDAVVSEFSLRHLGAGFIETRVTDEIAFCGKRVSEAKLPKEVIIAAIVRGDEIIIPSGQDVFQRGDRIVIFVTQNAQKKLEKLLGMTLDFFV